MNWSPVDKVIKNNCFIRKSNAGITIEAMVDGIWKDILIFNHVGLKNSDIKQIEDFVDFVNKDVI